MKFAHIYSHKKRYSNNKSSLDLYVNYLREINVFIYRITQIWNIISISLPKYIIH